MKHVFSILRVGFRVFNSFYLWNMYFQFQGYLATFEMIMLMGSQWSYGCLKGVFISDVERNSAASLIVTYFYFISLSCLCIFFLSWRISYPSRGFTFPLNSKFTFSVKQYYILKDIKAKFKFNKKYPFCLSIFHCLLL